jgi:hypothetical protein
MPRVFDKVYELLGTGSIPTTDALGNTVAGGSYTAAGIDFWSLPGLITPMSHNGVFKRGPVALYVSGNRNSWWGARIQDANTPIVEIYSVSTIGSTLRYTSSVMPAMPRSFDFELNKDGHVVIVAEIGHRLYGHYSFSSSLGWPLIASSAFTPKLVSVDNTVGLSYVDNNIVSQSWYPRIYTAFADNMFTGSNTFYDVIATSASSNAELLSPPDTLGTASFTAGNGIRWNWSGSISGTMLGIFTASMKGHITGTVNDGPYGSFDIMPPSTLYSSLVGEVTGVVGGNFTGTGIVTGSFYGSLAGYFSGTFYTVATASLSVLTTQQPTMTTAPTGNNFLVGSISGTLVGGTTPYSESALRPIYFINDFVTTKSNRLQLTYGRYDPITQHAAYTTSLSHINIVASGAGSSGTGVTGTGGVPFAVEIYKPTAMRPRFMNTKPAFSFIPTSMSGGWPIPGTVDGIFASMVTNYAIIDNDYGFGYSTNYMTYVDGGGSYTTRHAAMNSSASQFQYVRTEGGGGTGGVGAPHPGAAPTIRTGSYIYGLVFQSASSNQTIFDGTHHEWRAAATESTLAMAWSSFTLTFGGYEYRVLSESFGTNNVNPIVSQITPGVKLRPILSEPTATLTATLIPTSTEYILGLTGSTTVFNVSSSTQLLRVPVSRSIRYTVTPFGSADVTGSAPPEYSTQWYPRATLYLQWSGSGTGTRYNTTMSVDTYLIDAV